MARFMSVGCIVIGSVKYGPNTIFADTVGSALAGDVVWPGGMNIWTMGPNLVPLDAGAHSMMQGSRFANDQNWRIDGAHSVR